LTSDSDSNNWVTVAGYMFMPEELQQEEYGYRFDSGLEIDVRVISQVNNDDSSGTQCPGGSKKTTVTLASGLNSLIAAASGAAVASVFSILF
jgi:hypothetical protein